MLQELTTTLTGDGRALSLRFRNPRRQWRPGRRAVAAVRCAVVVIALGILLSLPAGAPLASPLTAADPCALTETAVLTRFGTTTRETARGNFNRCDVIVTSRSGSEVDVRVVLESRVVAGATIDRPGPAQEFPNPQSGDSCVWSLLSGQNQVKITVKLESGPPSEDLCAMARAASDYAKTVLDKGAIPRRRSPFDTASLASVNACRLLGYGNLTAVLGAGLDPPGIGEWRCRWTSTTSQRSVTVLFDQNKLIHSIGGRPTRIGGREARIVMQSDVSRPSGVRCGVWVFHRRSLDAAGQPVIEFLRVQVSGSEPPDRLCKPAQELSEAAVTRLPTDANTLIPWGWLGTG